MSVVNQFNFQGEEAQNVPEIVDIPTQPLTQNPTLDRSAIRAIGIAVDSNFTDLLHNLSIDLESLGFDVDLEGSEFFEIYTAICDQIEEIVEGSALAEIEEEEDLFDEDDDEDVWYDGVNYW